MRAAKLLVLLVPAITLFGCGEGFSDLRTFVKDSDKSAPRKIDPLPQVKPFAPFAYEGFDLPDPFKPRKLAVKQNEGAGGGLGSAGPARVPQKRGTD